MHNSPPTLLPPLNRMELGLLRDQHQRPGGDRPPGRHRLLPHLAAPVPEARTSASTSPSTAPARTARPVACARRCSMDFADRYFPATPPKAGVDEKTAAAHAKAMSGTWAVSRASRSNFLAGINFIGQTKVGVDKYGEPAAALPRAQRQTAALDRDRTVRLVRPERPRPRRRAGHRRQAGALQLRHALPVHGVRARSLVRRQRLADAAVRRRRRARCC